MSKKQINEFDMHGLETPPTDPHVEPTQDFIPHGEIDHEGAMAKADLYKIANYSVKLFKKLDDDAQLEAWVQAKITKAADYIASVYHYLEYEMEFSDYGKKLENSEMFNESEKAELKKKLSEARAKIAELKIVQLQKLEEAKSPKAKKDWDKDGKIESEKDEVIGSRRKAAGLDESQDDDDDDDVRRADDELKKRKIKLPKVKDKEVPIKKTNQDRDEEALDEVYGQGVYESWDDDDEDPDVKRADSELKKRGIKLPKAKADPDKDMSKLAKKSKKEDDLGESYNANSLVNEGSGPYQLSDPKHPKFKANYEKFKKANPDKKLSDFVDAMKKKDKVGLDESWDEDDDEDADVKRADAELKKRGVKLPKVKHKEVPVKKTAKDKEEELDEGGVRSTARRVVTRAISNDTETKKALGKDGVKKNKQISRDEHKNASTDDLKKVVDRNRSAKVDEASKPDFLDLDKDGNKKEPMKKAAKEKECVKESADLARIKEFLTRLNG